MACRAVARGEPAFAQVGFGAAASARIATLDRWMACRAVACEASEGWWGKKDSNLRSHKTADLQSAPFATRDTPPFNNIGTQPLKRAATRPWMTLIPGADGELPVGRVYGRSTLAKSTKGGVIWHPFAVQIAIFRNP